MLNTAKVASAVRTSQGHYKLSLISHFRQEQILHELLEGLLSLALYFPSGRMGRAYLSLWAILVIGHLLGATGSRTAMPCKT